MQRKQNAKKCYLSGRKAGEMEREQRKRNTKEGVEEMGSGGDGKWRWQRKRSTEDRDWTGGRGDVMEPATRWAGGDRKSKRGVGEGNVHERETIRMYVFVLVRMHVVHSRSCELIGMFD